MTCPILFCSCCFSFAKRRPGGFGALRGLFFVFTIRCPYVAAEFLARVSPKCPKGAAATQGFAQAHPVRKGGLWRLSPERAVRSTQGRSDSPMPRFEPCPG